MTAAPGHEALVHLGKALAAKPKPDGHAFSQTTMCLTRFRNEMIDKGNAEGHSEASRERLARLNSVIAVVMGGHFPLGEIPWGELEKADGWLKKLVSEVEAGS